MSLKDLKKYNEVTEPARLTFQQTRQKENQAFYDVIGGGPHSSHYMSLTYAKLEELLKNRDIVMRKAEKDKTADSARLWQEYKRQPKLTP